jgi:hypothetical protein
MIAAHSRQVNFLITFGSNPITFAISVPKDVTEIHRVNHVDMFTRNIVVVFSESRSW